MHHAVQLLCAWLPSFVLVIGPMGVLPISFFFGIIHCLVLTIPIESSSIPRAPNVTIARVRPRYIPHFQEKIFFCFKLCNCIFLYDFLCGMLMLKCVQNRFQSSRLLLFGFSVECYFIPLVTLQSLDHYRFQSQSFILYSEINYQITRITSINFHSLVITQNLG